MGKPYLSEIAKFEQTFQWAREVELTPLIEWFDYAGTYPLIALGSGGSLTSAYLAAMLHSQLNKPAKAVTPFELSYLGNSLRESSVLMLTASGKNTDILGAFKFSAFREPKALSAICLKKESPLSKLSNTFSFTNVFEFQSPVGSDGFLATNSLLATYIFLIRVFDELIGQSLFPLKKIPDLEKTEKEFGKILKDVLKKDTWLVLCGGWTLPPAIDLESKGTEAALTHVQLTDYRNFAHGRHNWLSKRASDTAIISFITPAEADIAEKTLKLIPNNIPILRVNSELCGPSASLQLLVKAMYLISFLGKSKNVDPGKPKVAQFGRKIYHLKSKVNQFEFPIKADKRKSAAIQRKYLNVVREQKQEDELLLWERAYKRFLAKIEGQAYSALVFDYDGTLSDAKDRFMCGVSEALKKELTRLLKNGILIGVASGRGKSVGESLRASIPELYWDKVLIAYYNGGIIADLSVEKLEDLYIENFEMAKLITLINKRTDLTTIAKVENRPTQISLLPLKKIYWSRARQILLDLISDQKGFRVVESSHSVDIIPENISKRIILEKIEEKLKAKKDAAGSILCIGDKGAWPGNDYDLLSTPFSLSVDEVSFDIETCWNLASMGFKGTQATLEYLSCIKASPNSFRLKF